MALCEKFIKPLVVTVLLQAGDASTHRNIRVAGYKILLSMLETFDVIAILEMEDEPSIAQDLLEMVIADS